MNIDFLRNGNKKLVQFIEFCKDTTLWKELQYQDAVRQLASLAFLVSRQSGIPLAVLLAKAWEEAFRKLFRQQATFIQICDFARHFLKQRSDRENERTAEVLFEEFSERISDTFRKHKA